MISIQVGADLHGNLPLVEKCDILVLLGDIFPFGSIAFQKRWQEEVLLPWLEYAPAKEKILLAGNHDFLWEQEQPSGNFHYLEDSGVELYGLHFWGSPWTHPKRGSDKVWAFRKKEKAFQKRLARASEGTDILLTHSPPWGIGDWTGSRHAGSLALLKAIEKISPSAVFYGHIHEGGGPSIVDGRFFLNATLGRKKKELWRVTWSRNAIFWER